MGADREQTFAVRKVAEYCRGCGHPKECHTNEGPCHATIYAELPMGMNANRCQCMRFA